ncbi:stalk domain-containing protein [Peptococcus simiae]|uniref:Stalk domain-containing protein n=1 Tax=Peptococcus simiae TaxID=1643805 RepID=A0ABW9GZS2_9FIRM
MKGSLTKKATAAVLAAALLASASPAQATESHARDITITVDGRTIPQTDQKAFIKDGRTMVPLRTVMEGLKMNVNWVESNRSIFVSDTAKNLTYVFYADKPYFNVYGTTGKEPIRKVNLDVAPYITVNNRVVVPLRAIGETYGKVDWNNDTSTVAITAGQVAQPSTPAKPTTPTVKPPVAQPNKPAQPTPAPSVKPSEPTIKPTPSEPSKPSVKKEKKALSNEERTFLKGIIANGLSDKASEAKAQVVRINEIKDKYVGWANNPAIECEEVDNDLILDAVRGKPDVELLSFYEALEAPRKPFTADQLRMLELINAARAEHGLKPVKLSPALCEGADIRAREYDIDQKRVGAVDYNSHMKAKANGWNPHIRLDGTEPTTVLKDLGLSQFISKATLWENLATIFTDENNPDEIFNMWMNSPGHKANILYPNHKYVGVGYDTQEDNVETEWALEFQP